MITAVGTIRADRNSDKTKLLEGCIVCRDGALAVAENHLDVVQKIAKVKLSLLTEPPAKLEDAAQSTPHFDLLLQTPQTDLHAHRSRLEKTNQQLAKCTANIA